jgi:hypothetical protein
MGAYLDAMMHTGASFAWNFIHNFFCFASGCQLPVAFHTCLAHFNTLDTGRRYREGKPAGVGYGYGYGGGLFYIQGVVSNATPVSVSVSVCHSKVRLQASGMGLFYIRVNVKALVTGSITKWSPNSTSWHDQETETGLASSAA